MGVQRSVLGLIEGKPIPLDVRDAVINRMCALFIAEALAAQPKAKRKQKVSDLSDADWLESLEHEPALRGINIRRELGIAQLWAKQNKRQPTRRFLMNWFLKAEKIVDLKAMGAQHATGLRPPPPAGPPGWESWLTTELSLLSPEADGYSQLLAARNCRSFSMLPQSVQSRCRSQMQGKAQTA